MTILKSIWAAFCTFSRIPMPHLENVGKESMRYMMAFFPLVGVVIGAVLFGWWALCDWLGIGSVLRAAGIALIPLGITGGIHLDGFTDVVDAISSWGTPEKRREILKDPHVGAFAAMGAAAYLVLYVALGTELDTSLGLCLAGIIALVPVFGRSLSGLAVIVFPRSSDEGMLAAEQMNANQKTSAFILAVFALLSAAGMILLLPLAGCITIIGALVVLAATHRLAMHTFGGMSGDLAGFFLSVAELVMLACIIFTCKAAML